MEIHIDFMVPCSSTILHRRIYRKKKHNDLIGKLKKKKIEQIRTKE